MSILAMSSTIFLHFLITGVTSIDPDLGPKDKGNLEKLFFFLHIDSLNQSNITVLISQIKELFIH